MDSYDDLLFISLDSSRVFRLIGDLWYQIKETAPVELIENLRPFARRLIQAASKMDGRWDKALPEPRTYVDGTIDFGNVTAEDMAHVKDSYIDFLREANKCLDSFDASLDLMKRGICSECRRPWDVGVQTEGIMVTSDQYSPEELCLLEFFGLGAIIKNSTTNPSAMYHMAIEKSFLENYQGEPVEALRRGYRVLCRSCGLRKTKEFQDAIKFSGEYPQSYDGMFNLKKSKTNKKL